MPPVFDLYVLERYCMRRRKSIEGRTIIENENKKILYYNGIHEHLAQKSNSIGWGGKLRHTTQNLLKRVRVRKIITLFYQTNFPG